MSTLILNKDVLTIAAGIKVSKATSLVAQSLTSLFTITGGRIILVSLVGELTVANDATATTVALGHTSSVGVAGSSPVALASAVAITSKEIGTKIGLGQTAGAALVVGTNASTPLVLPPRQVIGQGVITYTGAVGAGTASIKYDLVYVPLDHGTVVTAA
jgi:hypothetical protein